MSRQTDRQTATNKEAKGTPIDVNIHNATEKEIDGETGKRIKEHTIYQLTWKSSAATKAMTSAMNGSMSADMIEQEEN